MTVEIVVLLAILLQALILFSFERVLADIRALVAILLVTLFWPV